MGRAKSEWMEAEDRGWYAPEGFACEDCVEDAYLKEVVRQNVASRKCSFCGKGARSYIAAPVEALMHPIADTVFYFFNDPTHAGVPWDGGPVIEGTYTADMLMSLPLECHDDLFEVIVEAFTFTEWVPSARGHWMSSHTHEILEDSWHSFVSMVKHETRFHFHRAGPGDIAGPEDVGPGEVLSALGQFAKSMGLVKEVPAGTRLYRARVREHGTTWTADASAMSAPPSDLARAGRMNPAGISYLYCALDAATAVAETIAGPPVQLEMAEFEAMATLAVLNLCDIPGVPSIFDSASRHTYEALLFLESFIDEISQPVRKDGHEHIDYVPSQVVCEWFAQVFEPSHESSRLDGLLYPSAVAPGGRNLVLFPTERGLERAFGNVEFRHVHAMAFHDWRDVAHALELDK